MFVEAKSDGRIRPLVDLRFRNDNTQADHTQIPEQNTILNAVGRGRFRSKIHLSDAYFQIEFVTGRTGPRKKLAPGPFPRPAPLNGLGRSVFFGIPGPCPRSGPRPTHTPNGSPLKLGGNKRGPVQGMSEGGPRAGAGRGLP